VCVPPEEDCAALGDEDGNGLADCADPACIGTPLCRQAGPLAFEGIRTDMAQAEATDLGFVQCFRDLYNVRIDHVAMLANCQAAQVLVACRPVGAAGFTVAATGERDEVFAEVAAGADIAHDHNGARWYYTPNFSFGFGPLGSVLSRSQCDTSNDQAQLKLCWHTLDFDVGGYRCGATTGLNNNAGWERLVYQRNGRPFGVQQNVNAAQVAAQGWQVCHSSLYSTGGHSLAQIRANCQGDDVMMACRPVGAAAYTLAAAGDYAEVFFDVGNAADASHLHNGVQWYYSETWSWGFAPAGEPVNRTSCDFDSGNQTVPELRMCLHTSGGNVNGGYRCGANSLNGSAAWERVILHR
ncbi:MAG: hypothetical protein KC620_15740, partial [Myxococcales bacterium]|nr:hypothetical protein [Myxococcales bacterium]